MVSPKFSVVFAAVASFITGASAAGGYGQSCSGGYIYSVSGQGWFLATYCGNGSGGYDEAVIHLGSCFGNDDGHLVHQENGSFGNSCDDESLSGTILYANCLDTGGNYISTSINTNLYITNEGGELYC